MYLDKFFEILSLNPNKVCYGKRSVEFALSNQAVETLLISDKLFRAKNVSVRKSYVSLVDNAERKGVQSVIFSSMNPSGESKSIKQFSFYRKSFEFHILISD